MFRTIRTRLTFSHLAGTVVALTMNLSGFLLLSLLGRYLTQAPEAEVIVTVRGVGYKLSV